MALNTIGAILGLLAALIQVYHLVPTREAAFSFYERQITSPPEVILSQGKVLGKLFNDGTYPESIENFLSIPYALAPVANLRYRPAVPVSPSDVTIEAFEYGPR